MAVVIVVGATGHLSIRFPLYFLHCPWWVTRLKVSQPSGPVRDAHKPQTTSHWGDIVQVFENSANVLFSTHHQTKRKTTSFLAHASYLVAYASEPPLFFVVFPCHCHCEEVGTQSISPLLWSIQSGSIDAARAPWFVGRLGECVSGDNRG